jgi:hypothetical protein
MLMLVRMRVTARMCMHHVVMLVLVAMSMAVRVSMPVPAGIAIRIAVLVFAFVAMHEIEAGEFGAPVKPETVLRWHRRGWRAYWAWRSNRQHRSSGRRPTA